MTTRVVFGGGGVAREVAWLLSETQPDVTPNIFVVADKDWTEGTTIDGVRIVPDREFDATMYKSLTAYIAIGIPAIRQALHKRLALSENIEFPSLVHTSARLDQRPAKFLIGQGVIIYPLTSMTTGISLGDFVQINPCATIGHGTHIGPYTTICPGANISGEAKIGAGCFIGAGAVIKEGIRITDRCVIGAGAVVVSDILDTGTWAGVPARKIDR